MSDPLAPPVPESEKKFAEKIKKHLASGESYKTSQGYYEQWAEYQRFWEGDQWPAATEETKSYPRPVTNHFAEIIEMKVAGLTYESPEIYYEPKKGSLKNNFKIQAQPVEQDEEPFEILPSEMLSVATEHVMDHNEFEQWLESFTRSSSLLGDGILYTYWDNDIMGSGEGGYIGEIGLMEIDIADFYVGDPTEPDLQKQPYVIITERRPRKVVQEEYRQFSKSVDYLKNEAKTDSSKIYDHEKIEQAETDYVDLIHYWERKVEEEEVDVGGEKVTRKDLMINYYVISQDFVIREEKDYYLSKRFPFVNFGWYPRRKSFYSKPEAADLINNQKELNRLQGIALLGAYKTGLPNIRYKEDFVRKEDIPVGPGGQVIKDLTPVGQGWGVDYLQPPTIAAYIPLLKDAMTQGMKDTSGVHEAWSGKAPSAHLNASAIMALQEAAGVRIRGIQRRLYSAIRDLGILWLGYMQQYYTEDRLYRVYGKNNVEGLAWFTSQQFKNMEFDVKVTMGSASPYSKTVVASTLENMLERGIIDGDLYLRMLPPEVFPRVLELLELIEDRMEEQQQMMLEQQKALTDEVVAQTIEQAKQSGVEITPEALQIMQQMIQEQIDDTAQD